jgi:hypothetical protein
MWFGLACTRRAIRRHRSTATNLGSGLARNIALNITALFMGYAAVKVDAIQN